MEKAYLYIVNIDALDTERVLSALSEERKAYVLRCTDIQTRQHRAAGELLCAYALRELGESVNLPFSWQKGEYGKPYLPNSRWRFNIAHSGSYICCALTDCMEIGADVEKQEERDFVALAKRFCSENEYRRLMGFAQEQLKSHFYEFWARKEALSKRDGVGMHKDFRTVDVTKWHVCCFERDGYTYAVATDKAFELVVRDVHVNCL